MAVEQTSVTADVEHQSPFVVELAGPAGAGKTTLLRALCQREQQIQPNLHISKMAGLPFFLRNMVALGPAYLWGYRHSRWFTDGERRSMIYLKAWHHLITRHPSRDMLAVLLDHGPIYRLAMLREFGPPFTQSAQYMAWWTHSFEQWAATLNLVICLDAPDATLMHRIHSRKQDHVVRGKPQAEIFDYLARYRGAIIELTDRLVSTYGVCVLHVDSAQMAVDQIVDAALAALHFPAEGANNPPILINSAFAERPTERETLTGFSIRNQLATKGNFQSNSMQRGADNC